MNDTCTKNILTGRFTQDFSHLPVHRRRKLDDIQMQARVLAAIILANVPDCREQALALTKVEEAVQWSISGVIREVS